MFISHKNNTIQTIQETEWECRRISKGLTMPEYWAWIETITSDDDPPVVTYPSEDFTIVECTDEDVPARLVQLGDYFHNSLETGKTYNIKYYASKRDSEIVDVEAHKDEDGKDVAATYKQSHFIKDDTDYRAYTNHESDSGSRAGNFHFPTVMRVQPSMTASVDSGTITFQDRTTHGVAMTIGGSVGTNTKFTTYTADSEL